MVGIGDSFILNTLEQMTHYSSIVINPKILKQIKAKTHGCKTGVCIRLLNG